MYGVEVTLEKSYKAKRKIIEPVGGGDHVQSFKRLWDYEHSIKQNMSGVLTILKVTKSGTLVDKCKLERFVGSFPGLRDGFKEGCRPFIVLDGCHLKGPFEGVLLSAVALDTNQRIFLLVVCVWESKNTDNWTWFLGI